MNFVKKQILILFFFSAIASVGLIIHGIYMDLNFEEIKRLTFKGALFTFFVIFPSVLFLEWVFDLNNKKEINRLKEQIKKLSEK